MTDLARQTRAAQTAQTQGADRVAALTRTIQGTRNAIGAALAERIGADRFLRAAVTTIRTTPKLAQCTDESLLGALFVAAQLGLEIGGPRGLVYLVPYGREATLVIGYRGWIKLWRQTGQVAKVETVDVREGDVFEQGSDSRTGGRWYRHVDADPNDSSRTLLGVVAQVVMRDGTVQFDYMNRDDILARRPSRWTGTPWEKWEPEMMRKTVLRHLAKLADSSTDDETLALAADADDTVQRRLEGIPAHDVEHVPVQGRQSPQQRQPVLEQREPDPTPPDDDDTDAAAEWEAEQQREADAFLAAQEAGDR